MVPQNGHLILVQLEHEVWGKPVKIPLDRAHQRAGGNTVEGGNVCVEDYLLPSDEQNGALNPGRCYNLPMGTHAALM